MQDVAIFWDYENCPAPSNAPGWVIANNIRLMAQPFGRIKSLKAYLAITDQYTLSRAVTLRSEFQASGVSLIDCPHNGRKEVADKMIIVDMLTYAIDNPAPSTIILITGDRDFAYPLSILRLRQYQVVLFTLPNAHTSLTAQASICMDWINVLNPGGQPGQRTATNPPKEDYMVASKGNYDQESLVSCGRNQVFQRECHNQEELRSATEAHSRCSSGSSKLVEVEFGPDPSPGRGLRPPSNQATALNLNSKSASVLGVQTARSPLRDSSPPEHALTVKVNVPSEPSIPHPKTKSLAPNINEPSPKPQTLLSTLPSMEQSSTASKWCNNNEVGDSRSDPSIIYPVRPASAPGSLLSSPKPPEISETESHSPGALSVEDVFSIKQTSLNTHETTKAVAMAPNTTGEFPASPATPITSLKTSFPSIVAITRSTPHVVRPIFKTLVEVLQDQRIKGQLRPQCRKIANNVARNGITYKNAGVTKFGQYAELARKEGIVELGEKGGERWISLKPAWWNVKLI